MRWIGCGECDSGFTCHNGQASCIRVFPQAKTNNVMQELLDVVHGTNWPLLNQQKHWLMELLDQRHINESHKLWGLVSFLDAVQDAVADSGLRDEAEVFPGLYNEEDELIPHDHARL